MFKLGERVVAKGHWSGEQFESSQVVVKHSEEYVEDNPNRVDYELEDPELEYPESEDPEPDGSDLEAG